MDRFPDDLPPELEELGKRMSTERPIADDGALDRVMTRARGAREPRGFSLMWRSSGPRTRTKRLAISFAVLATTAGFASGASGAGLGSTLRGLLQPNASSAAISVDIDGFCADPTTLHGVVDAGTLDLADVQTALDVAGLTGNFQIINIGTPVLGLADVTVCASA